MPLMVSTNAAAPYARVKQHLKDGLARGRWAPGALMPSEAELVAQFAVSRMTVNRALRELQAEGLVTRTQGVGTFAAPLHRVSSTLTIRDLHALDQALGLQFAQRPVDRHAADAELRRQLGLGGHQLARVPAPAGQAVLEMELDARVGRCGKLGAGQVWRVHGVKHSRLSLSRQDAGKTPI
jgi:DNA-binding GntR family transcriptional regulator